ncbi:MAG: hypothetical protein M5R36_27480 [Deltaproteobacteria bacterium]|nr:hypothetical protein [Deltaproteobacteria bacterium]
MAPDHFFAEGLKDVVDRETAFLLGEARHKEDFPEHVAELFLETGKILAVHRVDGLKHFFEKIFAEAFVGLLVVPRAAVRASELPDNFHAVTARITFVAHGPSFAKFR